MAALFPNCIGLIKQNYASYHTANLIQECFEENKERRICGVGQPSQFPRAEFRSTFVQSTTQHTNEKIICFALGPDTTASFGIHASTGQRFLVAHREHTQY